MWGIPSRKPKLHTARIISSFLLKTCRSFLPKPSMMKVTATSTMANCTVYMQTYYRPNCCWKTWWVGHFPFSDHLSTHKNETSSHIILLHLNTRGMDFPAAPLSLILTLPPLLLCLLYVCNGFHNQWSWSLKLWIKILGNTET